MSTKTAIWKKYQVFLLVLISLSMFSGCRAEGATPEAPTESPTTQPVPTEVVVEPTDMVAEPVDECLLCHTDKDQLIATAKEEEEVVHESSGPG